MVTRHVATVAAQIGGEVLQNTDQWFNRFQIKSATSSRVYVIAQRRADNEWGCSCPGWRHYRHCKHLTDVLQRLSQVKVLAAFDTDTIAMLTSARTAYLDLGPEKALAAPSVKGRVVDLT